MNRKISNTQSLDWVTLLLFAVMVFIGWISIYASSVEDVENFRLTLETRAGKELLWIGASLVLAILVLITDSKFFEAFAYPIYGVLMLLLIAVLFIGVEVKGATSWIAIGSFRLQPAEFMKFATALALAKVLSKFNFRFNKFSDLFKAFVLTFLPSVMILLQNDTGSALVYASLILVMYRQGLSGVFLTFIVLAGSYFIVSLVYSQFVAFVITFILVLIPLLVQKMKREILHAVVTVVAVLAIFIALSLFNLLVLNKETIALICLAAIASGFLLNAVLKQSRRMVFYALFVVVSVGYILSVDYAFNSILEEHQKNRIEVLLGIKNDPYGAGYNVAQSKIAIGSGGFAGKGFLQGTYTKYNYVPEQSTDFIFCTIGEEWGFLGSFVVIGLFTFFLLRLVFLAERQRSLFSRLYGYGVFSIFFFHFAINIAMTIGLAPVIGIPLPFFSYGGSSLWGFTILLFIFLKLDSNRLQILA